MTNLTHLSPQEVLLAVVGVDARSYAGDRTPYNAIRDFAFTYTCWALTPKGNHGHFATQEQINAAPKWLLMDSILNACESFDEGSSDDRTFMEIVGASMGGMSEVYTIKGEYVTQY